MTPEELDLLREEIRACVGAALKETLTLEEAAAYMGLTKWTLYKMTAAREIPYSKPKGKTCYFKRKDLDEWMASAPVATASQQDGWVQAYCMTHPRPLYSGGRKNWDRGVKK